MIYLALIVSLIAAATAQFAPGCVADSAVCIENEICNSGTDECDYASCTSLTQCTTNYPEMNAVKCEFDAYDGICMQNCTVTTNYCYYWFFDNTLECDSSTGLCGAAAPPNCVDNPTEVVCKPDENCDIQLKSCEYISCSSNPCDATTYPNHPICDVYDHCTTNCTTQISTYCYYEYYSMLGTTATCFPESGKCLRPNCANSPISEACEPNEICNSTSEACEKIPCDNGVCSDPNRPICDLEDYCAPNCTSAGSFCADTYSESVCFTDSGKCMVPNCVNSPDDEACAINQICDGADALCKYITCKVNADCTEEPALPVCDGDYCTPYCTDTNKIDDASTYCTENFGSGNVCDPTLQECVKYCTINGDCNDDTYVCDKSTLYNGKGICKDITTCTDDEECQHLYGIKYNFDNPIAYPLAKCDEVNRICDEECELGGCNEWVAYQTAISSTGVEDIPEYTCNTDNGRQTCEQKSCPLGTECATANICVENLCVEATTTNGASNAPTSSPMTTTNAPTMTTNPPTNGDHASNESKSVERLNVFGRIVVGFSMVLSFIFI